MTRCVADKWYGENGSLTLYLSAFGHADYDENGKDIVCSAVSSLCTSLANTLLKYGVPKECIRMKEGNFLVNAYIVENHSYCEGAFDMAVIGLRQIAEEYPENVFCASGVSH